MDESPKGIQDTSNGRCNAALNIAGKDFRCQLGVEHDGWAHANDDGPAIWIDSDPPTLTRPA